MAATTPAALISYCATARRLSCETNWTWRPCCGRWRAVLRKRYLSDPRRLAAVHSQRRAMRLTCVAAATLISILDGASMAQNTRAPHRRSLTFESLESRQLMAATPLAAVAETNDASDAIVAATSNHHAGQRQMEHLDRG